MIKDFSLSFTVESDEPTMEQITAKLNKQLAGKIKDLIAQTLSGLDFDLKDRYWLLSPADEEEKEKETRRGTKSIPVWSDADQKVISIKIGSADWFRLIEQEKKFHYRYGDIRFTVRFEEKKSRGRTYNYWRAYATIGGKLRTRQIGKTDKLTRGSLDAVGEFFLNL